MMGDDTWLQVFPNHFHEAHPFPSFNVKDLHTICVQLLYNNCNRFHFVCFSNFYYDMLD